MYGLGFCRKNWYISEMWFLPYNIKLRNQQITIDFTPVIYYRSCWILFFSPLSLVYYSEAGAHKDDFFSSELSAIPFTN